MQISLSEPCSNQQGANRQPGASQVKGHSQGANGPTKLRSSNLQDRQSVQRTVEDLNAAKHGHHGHDVTHNILQGPGHAQAAYVHVPDPLEQNITALRNCCILEENAQTLHTAESDNAVCVADQLFGENRHLSNSKCLAMKRQRLHGSGGACGRAAAARWWDRHRHTQNRARATNVINHKSQRVGTVHGAQRKPLDFAVCVKSVYWLTLLILKTTGAITPSLLKPASWVDPFAMEQGPDLCNMAWKHQFNRVQKPIKWPKVDGYGTPTCRCLHGRQHKLRCGKAFQRANYIPNKSHPVRDRPQGSSNEIKQGPIKASTFDEVVQAAFTDQKSVSVGRRREKP